MNAKFVFSLALAAALPALADVATDNVIGVLRVDSSAAETIVSVPWVATSAAATDTPIPVTDIVKTAGLNIGDELYYYDSEHGIYLCWTLNAQKKWDAAKDGGSGTTSSVSSLGRGNAIILKRTAPIQDHFFLQGQVAKSGSAECTMMRSATAPVYSLIAPPTDKAVSLNDGAWSNVARNDKVILKGRMFKYKEGKWGTYKYDENFVESFEKASETDVTVAVGEGAWFVSAKGDGEAASVSWSNLPSVQ